MGSNIIITAGSFAQLVASDARRMATAGAVERVAPVGVLPKSPSPVALNACHLRGLFGARRMQRLASEVIVHYNMHESDSLVVSTGGNGSGKRRISKQYIHNCWPSVPVLAGTTLGTHVDEQNNRCRPCTFCGTSHATHPL